MNDTQAHTPPQEPISDEDRIISLLRANVSMPYGSRYNIRWYPLQDGDDHDSWTDEATQGREAWRYVAEMIVAALKDSSHE